MASDPQGLTPLFPGAASTFTAITPERVVVTRRFISLQSLPPDTPVIAHWHGERRTDAFLSTVGELSTKALAWERERMLREEERMLFDARQRLGLGDSIKEVAKKTRLDESVVRKLAKELRAAS